MKRVVVIMGNVCSGKTELSKKLAKKRYRHIVIDQFYREIIKKEGEMDFHTWESEKQFTKAYKLMSKEIFKKLRQNKDIILDSTGTVNDFKRLLKKIKKVPNTKMIRIFLKVPIKVLKERLRKRNKLEKDRKVKLSFIDLVKKLKKPKYDYIINGNKKQTEILKEVSSLINKT